MILFFDTETTGMPKNWKAPVTDLNNWPRMVQIAYLLYDINGNLISKADYIIKPYGYTIPYESTAIHGISTERALNEGKELKYVLEEFNAILNTADYLVAHNFSFDEKIVGAEFLRNNMQDPIPLKRGICTMESSTNFCAFKGPYGYKWPKLSELHKKLFNYNFEEAHNAVIDVNATAKCFWELKKIGIINLTVLPNSDAREPIKVENSLAKNKESDIVMSQIKDYCEQNEFAQIPLAAIAEAIMDFEFKCKQISNNVEINEEFAFLKDYWSKSELNIISHTLNDYQKEFLNVIKMEVIEEYKSFSLFSDEKNKSIQDKIVQLEILAFLKANDTKKYRDLVVHLYFYYLIRYKEFLPIGKRPTNSGDEQNFDYSNYSNLAKIAHENFEKLIANYGSILEKANNGGIPETIYTLVNKCNKELLVMKTEVGIQDEMYKKSSSKIIRLSTNLIIDWIKRCSNIMFIPIEGLSKGNTLFDVCYSTINEIDKIETDDITKTWFNNINTSITKLKVQSEPQSGCYIATMAYGNYDHPQVIILRRFRDNYLLTSKAGRFFVAFYYWLSPKLVTFCKGNLFVQKSSEFFLNIIIRYIIPK
jgi:DNA polymerase-3 subunit epsilon